MSSTDIDKPLPSDGGGAGAGGASGGSPTLPGGGAGGSGQPNVTLTIRMIMSGKEVGSIIGKGGEIINGIREESGAKIHISDGSVPERIVTVTGSTDAILKAFNLVSKKLEDDGGGRGGGGGGTVGSGD